MHVAAVVPEVIVGKSLGFFGRGISFGVSSLKKKKKFDLTLQKRDLINLTLNIKKTKKEEALRMMISFSSLPTVL